MSPTTLTAAVIGGGPAGLMAAEVLSAAGHSVVVADAMPTVGRKFLMAGKSGLNLTKAEPKPTFNAAYGDAETNLSEKLKFYNHNVVNDVSSFCLCYTHHNALLSIICHYVVPADKTSWL